MPTFEVVLSARPSNVRHCTQAGSLHWKDTKDGVYISWLIGIYICAGLNNIWITKSNGLATVVVVR